jgi:hypothetical protein
VKDFCTIATPLTQIVKKFDLNGTMNMLKLLIY